MKKYIKPTVEIVELTVKESLSALPSGLDKSFTTKRAATYSATLYSLASAKTNA